MLRLDSSIMPDLPRLTVASAIDILLVAALIYQFLMMIRGRRAAPILAGLAVLGAVYVLALYTQLELLRGEVTQEILLAVSQMAADSTGALIVLERDVGLRTFIESGVSLDGWVSR